jgi:hypothetical protein
MSLFLSLASRRGFPSGGGFASSGGCARGGFATSRRGFATSGGGGSCGFHFGGGFCRRGSFTGKLHERHNLIFTRNETDVFAEGEVAGVNGLIDLEIAYINIKTHGEILGETFHFNSMQRRF